MKNTSVSLMICFCFLFSNTIFSQKEIFKSGYIELINGDRIQGEIKQLSLRAHAEYVIFKRRNSDKTQKYYPSQIAKYYFDDSNNYEANSIPFKNSSGEIDYKKLFLKKLVSGDVDLYRLDYVIEESPSIFYDYQSVYYFIKSKGSDALVDLNEDNYRAKLKQVFQSKECQLSKKNKKFNDKGLTELIIEYNSCLGGTSKIVYSQKEKIKSRWGFSLGYTSPEIQLSDQFSEGFSIESARGYDVHVFFNPRINDWLACRFGLNYQYRNQDNYQEYTVSEFYDNEGEILSLRSNATLSHLIIPFHLTFNKRINNFGFYALSGVHFGTNIRNSFFADKVIFRFINNESIQFVERDNYDNVNLSDYELGWSVGAGGEFFLKNNHSVFLEFQYNNGKNNLDENTRFKMSHRSISFLIGYNFN